ncbi:MAG: uroporphyrinogen-III C-methyltransferase [Lachnospiraceae bacterium]|nr:uroporphyrinogen-III C-methyltransferase [Lachnospiraceae bacterium]
MFNKEVKRVSLVGVGPGDENLLTLKALKCIQNADVLVYDNLINPTVLNRARLDAKLIYAGKISGNHYLTQDEINETIAEYAGSGEYVVRLKGGDPYIFGRGGEEAEYLIERGIDFETVHGVSSFYAGLGYAGIPITFRGEATSFHVFTGHRKKGEPLDLDFKNIAKSDGSLVFLMGISNLPLIVNGLLSNGMNPHIGAAVVENGTRYNQRVFRGELCSIEEIAKKENIVSPALIVVGDVCKKDLSFFNKYKLPLSGKNILLTATRSLAEKMAKRFKETGANICEMSLIAIKEIEIEKERLLSEINDATHILFTSSNGVDIFFEQIKRYGIDIRSLYNKKICVIGSGSGEALNKYGVNADFIPSKFDSKSFLDEILPKLDKDSKVLMIRAKIGSDVLPKGLKSAGIAFSDIPVYDTIIDHRKKFELNKDMENFDYVVAASASGAKALVEMIEDKKMLSGKVVSIGPVTTKALVELGIENIITAKRYDVEGIIDAIEKL